MDSLYNLAVVVSVVDRLTGPMKNMATTVSNFEATAQKAKGMIEFGQRMAVSGALVQGAADRTAGALKNIMAPAVDVQETLGDLASLEVSDLESIRRAATDFSKVWSGVTEPEFISSAYSIKSGIATLSDSAVGEFTKMAALTAKATKAATGEMTDLFATGYGIYKDLYSHLTDIEFGEMFSAGIAASVQAFKTTGSGMAQALTTLGGAAATAQRPFEEQLAVLGMLQATMPGGEAGTKYRSFVQNAARAGERLGLSFVDANGQLLGIVEILDLLRGKYGETLTAMQKQEISKAFGTMEAVALIDLLYGKVDTLRGNVDNLGISLRQGTMFTENMASAMNTKLGAQMDVIGQNMTILKRSIGDELAPLVEAVVPTVIDFVAGFQNFASVHPTITRTILLLLALSAAALGILAPIITIGAGFTITSGYVIWGASQMGKAFILIKGGLGLVLGLLKAGLIWVKTGGIAAAQGIFTFAKASIMAGAQALPGLIASVWSFTSALLANPITWVVLAIMGLIGALYLLWRNWDTVTAYLGARWEWVKAVLAAAGTWISEFFTNLGASMRAKVTEFFGSGQALIQAFTDGIQSLIAKPAELVKTGLEKVRRLLPFSDAKEGPLSTLTASGMALVNTFAAGIQMRAPYLQTVAASSLGSIALPEPGAFSWDKTPFNSTPRFSMRETIRDTFRERETYTRDRRPIVLVVQGGQVKENDYDSYIDLALRKLEMQG